MAELADARDLKSREIFSRTGSTPASGTTNIAGWSSSVARRAHNPKVVRFKSHSRNQQKRSFCLPKVPFLFIQAAGLAYHPTQVGISSRARCALVSHHASACIPLRLDDIQCSALMIYRNKLRMIYTPHGVICFKAPCPPRDFVV